MISNNNNNNKFEYSSSIVRDGDEKSLWPYNNTIQTVYMNHNRFLQFAR